MFVLLLLLLFGKESERAMVRWERRDYNWQDRSAGVRYDVVIVFATCVVKDTVRQMRAKMYDLGVVTSRSRPRVSNDNPYSESLFRTVKYHPRWPSEGFKSLDEARKWVKEFVYWYNNEHRHSRIKFVTPCQRHDGLDVEILAKRKV